MSQQGTAEPGQNGHIAPFFRCALCPEPALLTCIVEASALGVGDVRIYLCQKDYDLLLARQQTLLFRQEEEELAAASFEQARQAILNAAGQGYGGAFPPREQLWIALRAAEKRCETARRAYRDADDASQEGHLARLRVLRSAGVCLALALCIEERAQQDSASDSAVSGTIARVTMAFLRSGGLTIREKEITRNQVVASALAIMRARATGTEDEAAELVAVEKAMEAMGHKYS